MGAVMKEENDPTQPGEESKENISSPPAPEEEGVPPGWTPEEMEEAEPYPLPEVEESGTDDA